MFYKMCFYFAYVVLRKYHLIARSSQLFTYTTFVGYSSVSNSVPTVKRNKYSDQYIINYFMICLNTCGPGLSATVTVKTVLNFRVTLGCSGPSSYFSEMS